MKLRLLHQRDLYLRLEFAVGVLVVIAFLLISGFRAIVDAAEPTLLDTAERGDRAEDADLLLGDRRRPDRRPPPG